MGTEKTTSIIIYIWAIRLSPGVGGRVPEARKYAGRIPTLRWAMVLGRSCRTVWVL